MWNPRMAAVKVNVPLESAMIVAVELYLLTCLQFVRSSTFKSSRMAGWPALCAPAELLMM